MAKDQSGYLRGAATAPQTLGPLIVENAAGNGLTDAELRATPVPVSGTFYPATQPVSGPLTDTELRATPVPVSGTFYPATQPVSGSVSVSNFPATQPVSGTIALDAGSLAALENVTVGGTVALDAASLTALENVVVSGTVALDASTLAALETISVANFPASQAVTGTFWQATQPVSGPLTDAQLRALAVPVSGTFWQATQPVSGTFWQATQPVSLATNTPDITDRAARINGLVRETPATLVVSATAATGVAATATLPAVAAQFHYINRIDIWLYATAARTGAATPVTVTTTNLPGSLAWPFETAQAIGTTIRADMPFDAPLRSSVVNTATTIVAPIATTGIWRINVYYSTGA